MTLPFAYSIPLFLVLLLRCGHSNGAARDVPMQDHFHISTNDPAQAGTKVCARDMESLHNFIHRSFGSEGELKIVETKYPTISAALLQDYIVLEDPQEIEGQGMVVCHPVSEALFCHYNVEAVKLVKVSLRGDSGDKVDAIAICHTDSSRWEHDHIVFRLLQVKPGSPVCHFLPAGHLVWVQSPASKAS
ncbi:hypothetical protein GH714_009538 [Hevea brasiliensis]|uniref:BURP domain-containing protein n=1 Tax=Hevea brasiliensis TaxID=3981 RepID=A0A6A6L0S5_HEVBR|nr:hypothetical protein GH714_009538 [Hevea brasiliensis]